MTQDEFQGRLAGDGLPSVPPRESPKPQTQGIVFSRVRLWTDEGDDCEFFIGGTLESYEDIEGHEECIDFREFLEVLPDADMSGITAHITTFTEGAGDGAPRPAGPEDIQRIYTAIAEVDIDTITGWTWKAEHSFAFDYDTGEQPGMHGIE